MHVIRQPIDKALDRHSLRDKRTVQDNVKGFNFYGTVSKWVNEQIWGPQLTDEEKKILADAARNENQEDVLQRYVTLDVPAYELLKQLHDVDPERFPEPLETAKDKRVTITAQSDEIGTIRKAVKKIDDPITLNVQEAFMTYLKVSFIAGLIFASPWVLYQLWLFVAAGLYPHERKYVYTYLPMSIILFLGGATFCFYAVFPTVLDFLLGFNERLKITAQIRISEWINFAVMMPLLFGVSFQLPLVMLFLQKISIFDVADFRQKRRMAILAIAFLSMMLTPTPDPLSMMMMMFPLLALYELGIGLCIFTQTKEDSVAA
jgi:sec-independent protein translocase protein TatC